MKTCNRTLALAVLSAFAWLPVNGLLAGEKANVATTAEKMSLDSPAEIAAMLAIRGEATKSPLLLLAAADMLGNARQSDRDTSEVSSKSEGSAKGNGKKQVPELTLKGLQQRALELATEGDERQHVQAWIDRPRSRGLEFEQGKDLDSVEVKGVTYKVLFAGVIDNGNTQTLDNVRFEGKKPASVLVIGDGDGDLDLWVYDGNNDEQIGSDVDTTSICVVRWEPRYLGPFRIKVSNVGSISEHCVILANW